MEVGKETPGGGHLAGSAETRIRLFSQIFEWSRGYFDDPSGSESLTR
jgi:hypothetical protein